MDLVEIAATANPPMCRLMDYGKFNYQEQRRLPRPRPSRRSSTSKIKFRPGTDDGDYNIKLRNIRRFLADGDKVKVTLRFRGREITSPGTGPGPAQPPAPRLADSIQVEQFPSSKAAR